jgi:hypothetical protein
MTRAKHFLMGQFLALLVASLPFVPVFPGVATYDGVGAASGDSIGRPMIGSKRYVLEKGRLYLLRQRTWHALVVTTLVREVAWREADLQELRQRFPECDDGSW